MPVQTCLISLDDDVAAEFTAALVNELDGLVALAGPADLLQHLESAEAARAVIAVLDAAELDVAWLRQAGEMSPLAQILVACRKCDDETWRRLLLCGCHAILRSPFAGIDLDVEFAGEPAVTQIFRRHALLHEQGKVLFRYSLPSDPQYIPGVVHIVALLAMEFGFSRADYTMNLPLAIDEALSNAIVHGNRRDLRKHVEVEGVIESGSLRLKVRDEGEGFRRDTAAHPLEAGNLMAPSGRGLFLIESVMDEVRYSQEGRCIEMIKRASAGPAHP